MSHNNSIWAIACYFNPASYTRRFTNYHNFRKRLSVPLVTVEWSRDASFELRKGDADILIQLSGGDVMWQKERLLNVALAAVPADCTKVAWLDCDVEFGRADWAEAASAMLDHKGMIQLFDTMWYLPQDVQIEDAAPLASQIAQPSLLARISRGEIAVSDAMSTIFPGYNLIRSGFAWAARRELIQRHGLYDACVLGSGPRAILSAALGQFEFAMEQLEMNEHRRAHYLKWAEAYHADVRNTLGVLPGHIGHLWHGDIRHRNYAERHKEFSKYNFDPATDIALTEQGCWRWSSDKTAMHQFVMEYFESRREDGIVSTPVLH